MKKIFNEFKTFISRGSVIDMAVGIIIGTAFTAIVNSLVKDLLMPLIGVAIGGQGFESLKIVLKAADPANGIAEAAINYGIFIQKILDFLIIAIVIFFMVKVINKVRNSMNKKEIAALEEKKKKEDAEKKEIAEQEAAKAAELALLPGKEIELLTEIRDLLSINKK